MILQHKMHIIYLKSEQVKNNNEFMKNLQLLK